MDSWETKTKKNYLCLMCFEIHDVLKCVGDCKHSFCTTCLSRYLEKHQTCFDNSFPCPSCKSSCIGCLEDLKNFAEDLLVCSDCDTNCDSDTKSDSGTGRNSNINSGSGHNSDINSGSGHNSDINSGSGCNSYIDIGSGRSSKINIGSGSYSGSPEEETVYCRAKDVTTCDSPNGSLEELWFGGGDYNSSNEDNVHPNSDSDLGVNRFAVGLGDYQGSTEDNVHPNSDSDSGMKRFAVGLGDYKGSNEDNVHPNSDGDSGMKRFAVGLGDYKGSNEDNFHPNSDSELDMNRFAVGIGDYKGSNEDNVYPNSDSELDMNRFAVGIGDYKGSNEDNVYPNSDSDSGVNIVGSGAIAKQPYADARKLVEKCQICNHTNKDVLATTMCPKCDQLYLCKDCTKVHAENTATKTHGMVLLKMAAMCVKHNALLTSYCCTCEEPACKICVTIDHGQHEVGKLSNLIQCRTEEAKAVLLERQEELVELKYQVHELTALKDASEVFDGKKDELLEEIDEHAENVINEVVSWQELLKAEVAKDFQVLEEIPEALKDVADTVQHLEWVISNASEVLSIGELDGTHLHTVTTLLHTLNMMKGVSLAYEGRVQVLLCGLYQTTDSFIPSPLPPSIGKLVKSSRDKNKAHLQCNLLFDHTQQASDPSGRLASMSNWASVPNNLTTPSYNDAVDLVKETVFRLTIAPGDLEEFMITLINAVNEVQVTLITVIDMINVIFEHAVAESNFTYTGARMCDWFVREYKPVSNEPIKFLNLLLKRCQVEQENSLLLVTDNPDRLQGFALFMAEIFLNVKLIMPNGEARIEILGKKLKELMNVLLQYPTDSNLKCVVRILKCTGAVLEDTERAQTGQALHMDNLIVVCMQQAMSPHLSESSRAMLSKVVEIRSTNWGRMESGPGPVVSAPEPRAPSPFSQSCQSEPVFFDCYGGTITREQAGFGDGEVDFLCPEEFQNDAQFNSSYDNGYLDTEIDGEIADAFEQFLIDTQQTA